METGERIASPSSVPFSLHMASSSASSSPAPPSTKSCPAPNPVGSSPLTTCGHLLQMTGDDCLNTSGSSSSFPLLSHPAFGIYTSISGRAEFGGLGGVGLSALAGQPQFCTFPDWWRPSEAHTRGAAAFFPPLVGLRPVFASTFKCRDNCSGVTRTVNGRSASSLTGNTAVNTVSFPVTGTEEKTKANCCPSQKSSQEQGQLLHKTVQKTKEKNPSKTPLETSSMSGSQSGSLSDSSSDGDETSSDPDDIEEEEDNDEDEDDQSNDSEDSDSESQVKWKVKNTSAKKKNRHCSADGNMTQDSHCDNLPLTSSYHLQSSSHPTGELQPTALFLQSSRTAEEERQQHISVIQATGLAASSNPLAQSHRDASPLPARSSPNAISLSNSPKHLPPSTSPKHFSHSSSPKQSSVSSSPKPLALCSPTKLPSVGSSPKTSYLSSPKPLCISSSSKPSTLLASQKPPHKPKLLMPSPKRTQPVDRLKESSGFFPDEMSLHFNSFKLKQPFHSKDSFKQTFSLQPSSQNCNDASVFLNHRPNGAIHCEVQSAPLALITKPRGQSSTSNSKPLLAATTPSYPMPINLSTGSKEASGSSASPLKSAALSGLAHSSRRTKTPKSLHTGKSPLKSNSSCPTIDFVGGSESAIQSSKDSDSDSVGEDFDDDEDEDDLEDEDSESSLSESESNLESDSDSSEKDMKKRRETEADSDAERTPLKVVKAKLSTHKSSSNLSANCSLLNLHIIKPPVVPRGLLTSTTLTRSGPLSNHNTPSRSPTFATLPGSGRRRRVTDERVLRLPLEFGWQRETRIRTVAGRLQGEVAYFAPCGKKLRQYPDVMKYLLRNGITEISRDNFSFSTKIKVGDFYEARESPEGVQWFLLAEEEITPCIIAMDGRRSRRLKSEHQLKGDGIGAQKFNAHPLNVGENTLQDVNNAKLLRKLEAQEIARQAAQIKLMRKLEKQAVAQAAKEAKKQQAIMAAEERRKRREQMKILKQQEKIKRIQQVRMEKELRAQQILEAKRKKKEEAANARILEAEKRNKEKELRRLQAVILKHQELERHRLDMERERRRQHMMLMKAVETRKKAEEKARLKKEKKDEKRLNKARKLELRRLELEKAKELKKPNEDMCLADHKRLPDLSRIPGLVLPGNAFSDCLMVLQFLRSFGKVLGLDMNSNILSLSDLQEGLLNIGDNMGKVQDLLVSMLSAALCDPGVPAGHKNKTSLGEYLTNVEINRDNVSEILQIYMEGNSEQTELSALALSLKTKAFQAHPPCQKASMLAFLVNELCCSKAVTSEIDKNIDQMTILRKDIWMVEGKLRKLRSIHGKRTGKRDNSVGGEDVHICVIPTARSKCKRKEGESEEEEDEDDDSEDQGEEDDEEDDDSGGKKGKKAEICEEEDDSVHTVSMEELEKQIEKTYKQQSQISQKLFDSSHLLRSMMIGQDRYRRRYWILPQCGGIFIEGMESGEGYEEVEKERERQEMAQVTKIKEEHLEETTKPVVSSPAQSTDGDTSTPKSQQDKDSLNLFLQKPGSLSKLSKFLELAKVVQGLDISSYNSQSSHSAIIPTTASYPSHPTTQTGIFHSPPPATPQQGFIDTTDTSVPCLLSAPHFRSSPWMTCIPQSVLPDDQLSKMLNEKSSQWFSLLPRSPCDESSVTSSSSPPAPSSSPQTISTKSPSSLSSNPLATASYKTPAGISNVQFSVLQQVKPDSLQSGMALCDVSSAVTSPSLPFPGTFLPLVLDLASQHAESNGDRDLLMLNNNTVNKTPEALNEKPPCTSFPAVEVAKTQDYPRPQPIPEDMLHGWWRVSDMQELHSLVKALHSRGIREKVLQKQLQKHLEYMSQLCDNNNDAINVAELEKQEVNEKTVESWCVEEQAMEVDISLLQQVEDLERKVISAGLQIKGWMQPETQSEREDLVYREHRLLSSVSDAKVQIESSPEQLPGTVLRWPNNPLDIAVTRLAELERNIDRSEDEVAPGMRLWRKALGEVRSSAQLSLCIQQLQKSIAWERTIMKLHCQICHKGDNGELLLLCDGCDKGCHTYCHKPKITTVPDGDWFCPTCVTKESGHSPRSKKQPSRTAGGGKKSSEVKRNSKPSVLGELIKEEAASSNSVPKKGIKEFKKRKREESPTSSQAKHDSPVHYTKKAKMAKDNTNGLAVCRELLAELEGHQDAWPFLIPVNLKAVPGYRKVIKKPMDFSTIREKLTTNQYSNLETFIIDVNLVFDNCEKFNEDDSEIGRAGHSMRRFFDKRWTELLK